MVGPSAVSICLFHSPLPSLRRSSDKPRQCMKKQRHHFVDKDLYSQSYGFSSSHVWMWAGSSHKGAKVLELQLQQQPFQWMFRVDFPQDWLVWSPWSPRDSPVFSSSTIRKHPFFGAQPSIWSSSHPYMTTGKTTTLTRWTFVGKVMSLHSIV